MDQSTEHRLNILSEPDAALLRLAERPAPAERRRTLR